MNCKNCEKKTECERVATGFTLCPKCGKRISHGEYGKVTSGECCHCGRGIHFIPTGGEE